MPATRLTTTRLPFSSQQRGRELPAREPERAQERELRPALAGGHSRAHRQPDDREEPGRDEAERQRADDPERHGIRAQATRPVDDGDQLGGVEGAGTQVRRETLGAVPSPSRPATTRPGFAWRSRSGGGAGPASAASISSSGLVGSVVGKVSTTPLIVKSPRPFADIGREGLPGRRLDGVEQGPIRQHGHAARSSRRSTSARS